MHPRKFIRDSLGFAAAQYVTRALLVLRGVLAARWLGPLAYGAWNALQLVMEYGAFSPLGTQQGLDQTVPPRIVEGDARALERLKRAGLFNVLVLSLLFAGGALTWMVRSDSKLLQFWGPAGAGLALLCMVLVNLAFYHATLLRSHGNITAVSTWYFVQALLGSVVGLALVPRFGAWGLLFGWVLANMAAMIVTRLQSGGVVPVLPVPSRDGLELLRVGLPMYVFTTSGIVMRSIDRVIVFKFLGTLALGYYSLAVMVLTFLLYLPDSIAYVLYPRLLRDFRASGNDAGAIRDPVLRATRVLAAIVAGLTGVAFLLARPAVALVLPKFVPGATAVRIVCFGVAGLAMTNLASIVLMTLGRRGVLIPAAVVMTALGAGLDLYAVRGAGGGPAGAAAGIARVAWATLTTYTLSGVTMLALAAGGLGLAPRRAAVVLAQSFGPLALAIALAFGIDRWGGHGERGMVSLVISLVMFLVLYSAAMMPVLRGLGLRQLVLEFNLPWPGRRVEAPPA